MVINFYEQGFKIYKLREKQTVFQKVHRPGAKPGLDWGQRTGPTPQLGGISFPDQVENGAFLLYSHPAFFKVSHLIWDGDCWAMIPVCGAWLSQNHTSQVLSLSSMTRRRCESVLRLPNLDMFENEVYLITQGSIF